MPLPIGAAISIGRAAAYVARYGRIAAPYLSQFGRGFARGLVPVYGSMSNLYISRILGKEGVARLAGSVVADLTVGAMTTSYVYGKLRSHKPIPSPGSFKRKRTSMSHRYLYEF